VRPLPEREYDAILRAGIAAVLAEATAEPLGLLSYGGFAETSATFEGPVVERVVAAAFSGSIKTAYDDTCVFTGLKIINGGGRRQVQAGHIHPVMASGPDLLRRSQ